MFSTLCFIILLLVMGFVRLGFGACCALRADPRLCYNKSPYAIASPLLLQQVPFCYNKPRSATTSPVFCCNKPRSAPASFFLNGFTFGVITVRIKKGGKSGITITCACEHSVKVALSLRESGTAYFQIGWTRNARGLYNHRQKIRPLLQPPRHRCVEVAYLNSEPGR